MRFDKPTSIVIGALAAKVNRILDSARVREERRQAAEEMERRRIDSVAAEKKTVRAGPRIGRALSPVRF